MEAQKVNLGGFNPLDYASGALALVGAVAGAVSANVAAAAFPLAGAVGLHLYNRQQLLKQVGDRLTAMEENYTTLIRNQNLHVVSNSEQIKLLQDNLATRYAELQNNQALAASNQAEELGKLQQFIIRVEEQDQETRKFGETLEVRHEQLVELVAQLQQVESLSHALQGDPSAAEVYYKLGLGHQRLGDIQGAVQDFGAAIRVDANYAHAYHQRGLLLCQLGNRQAAVEDFRQAAKLYFDSGDITNYQQVKELSKELYDLDIPSRHETLKSVSEVGIPEALSVAALFDFN